LGQDLRGNPADALLEVLDPDDNQRFSDHYVECEFDLSGVLWILTANLESAIPPPLRDRMEIIHFSSYTEQEKVRICERHLMEKNLEKLGLTQFRLRLDEGRIAWLIHRYTREAGVRELDRKISSLVHHMAHECVRGKGKKSWSPSRKAMEAALGPPSYKRAEWARSSFKAGVIAGLAYTAYGGAVLCLQGSTSSGKGQLKLTGKLGEVMQESAQAAFSFVRRHADKLGLGKDALGELDVHIHVPAGATPKEGPSAGLGIALLLASTLLGRASRPFWAVTGEIDLHGDLLPVGGIKEKIPAAQREGFTGVMLPRDNRPDVEDIPERERGTLELRFVDNFWQARDWLLSEP
ncbi:MAG: endopeptidase La, partial [Planctomycetes bacterium]|nr:endopeptidase La [Planctomycetota bacterium]